MPVKEPSLIAELVRETRQRLGLTQTQFAQELGVSFQSANRARDWADYAFTNGFEVD